MCQELLAHLVHADLGPYRIVGAGVDLQHVFHPPDELPVPLRGDHPALDQPGLEGILLQQATDRLGGNPIDAAQLDELVG